MFLLRISPNGHLINFSLHYSAIGSSRHTRQMFANFVHYWIFAHKAKQPLVVLRSPKHFNIAKYRFLWINQRLVFNLKLHLKCAVPKTNVEVKNMFNSVFYQLPNKLTLNWRSGSFIVRTKVTFNFF